MSGSVLPVIKSDHSAKWRWTAAIVVLGAALILIFVAAARRNKSVEQTVTLPQKTQTRPTVGTPVATVAPLPAADRDLELVGDRIAEAMIHLRNRQRGLALRALAAAESTTHLLTKTRPDLDPQILDSTVAELGAIEREIQRGETDSARLKLMQLERKIDVVNTPR